MNDERASFFLCFPMRRIFIFSQKSVDSPIMGCFMMGDDNPRSLRSGNENTHRIGVDMDRNVKMATKRPKKSNPTGQPISTSTKRSTVEVYNNKMYKNNESKNVKERKASTTTNGGKKMSLRDKILFTLSIFATLLLSLWSVAVRYGFQ